MIRYNSLRMSNINRWKRMYVFEYTNNLRLLDKSFFCDGNNNSIKHKPHFKYNKVFERIIYD